ncbi:hypothetical protein K3556_07315 [Aliiroseovarius sp. M344]|uniref:hypothetical protein n=1 Tax=Aliiroseovarius sp. M344 TaxID=2867010 RepID=UPI0021AD9E1A|nr:hypothetical protein [Aliiroseovarius sp. M344]UWQ15673.1 hypothetical protein K3556_07315 [Aliiroseovarius sp. M344]
MPNEDKPSKTNTKIAPANRCHALNRRGQACKKPAMPGSKYCTYHAPTIEKGVKKASRGAVGTAGYVAGLLSGAGSSDFFDYLKDKYGYKHFFPPVKDEQSSITDIELGMEVRETDEVVRYFLQEEGSDFLFENDDVEKVVKMTRYSYYPVEYGDSYDPRKITKVLEAAKMATSMGNSGVDTHLLFIHEGGRRRYAGNVAAVWLETEISDNLVLYALWGKGGDLSQAYRDTHVFDPRKHQFIETQRQTRGHIRNGVFVPDL